MTLQLFFIFSSTLFYFSNSSLLSIRVEPFDVLLNYDIQGRPIVRTDNPFNIRLVSNDKLEDDDEITFTNVVASQNENCNDLRRSKIFKLNKNPNEDLTVLVNLDESSSLLSGFLMICLRKANETFWKHQGAGVLVSFKPVYQPYNIKLILIILKSILIPIFLIFSGLFSALTLNLLSLTKTELRVLKNQGNLEEKKYSKAVAPLRKRGNLLFCTLVLMNTLSNVLIAILFHELISFYSILAATMLIVFFGEIVPQTLCSRFGLLFGNKMAWLTNIFVVLTFPFSFPVSIQLDKLLNDEVPMVYNRDRFQELINKNQKVFVPPQKSEIEDSKLLKSSNKTVGDIMIKLDDASMEEYDSILDDAKVRELLKKSFTRIPIYEKMRSNVVALLHIKDLELIDPSDALTIKSVCKFYNRPVNFVFEDTKLNIMLEEFKKGKSHMAFVQRVNSEGPGDPYYETLGMVTLEDVLNEIFLSDKKASIQKPYVFDSAIHCNSFTQYINKLKFEETFGRKKFIDSSVNDLSANQIKAIREFLSQFTIFNSESILPNILEKLLRQSQLFYCLSKNENSADFVTSKAEKEKIKYYSHDHVIIEKNKELDCFILLLEGKVKIKIGMENLIFNEKAFSYYGLSVLQNLFKIKETGKTQYIPDYSLKPDPLCGALYLSISKNDYLNSLQASMLKLSGDSKSVLDQFSLNTVHRSDVQIMDKNTDFIHPHDLQDSNNYKSPFM